jgi:succinyl-CoA synthetase alpha subunit
VAIFLSEKSRIIVQGMTGSEGSKHTRRMLAAGTSVVGGVTPGKAGQVVDFDVAAVPVFGSVDAAVADTGADVWVVFVPPRLT